ncbi:MAG: hypothetical protein IT307_13590 [Chloroflexi bacterium]|nr:hypothetical protein [Chloroflexota bacterium]
MEFEITAEQAALQRAARSFSQTRARTESASGDGAELIDLPDELATRAPAADTLTQAIVLEELGWGELAFARRVREQWAPGRSAASNGQTGEDTEAGRRAVLNAACVLGAGRACFDAALGRAVTPEGASGRGVDQQKTSMTLAELGTKVDACRALIWRAAWSLERGNAAAPIVAQVAWVYTTRSMATLANQALEIVGDDETVGALVEDRQRELSRALRGAGNLAREAAIGQAIDAGVTAGFRG